MFDTLFLVRVSVKFPLDLYMMFSCLTSFWYLLEKKRKRSELTVYNKVVIGATLFLLLLAFVNALISAVCYTIYYLSYFQGDPDTLLVLRVFIQPVSQTLNMFNAAGLLYLFYCQGRKVHETSER